MLAHRPVPASQLCAADEDVQSCHRPDVPACETENLGGAVDRAFYFWTGLLLTGFFGFFAVWTHDTYDSDHSHRSVWLTLVGSPLGAPV